jgi:hypothetical protein
MKPIPFPEMNKVYTAPKGWDKKTMGECVDLPVRQDNGEITSCFEMSPTDAWNLANGKKLYLTISADVQPVIGWEIK